MDMDADDKGLCLSLGFGTPPPVTRQQRREPTEAVEPTLTLSLSSSSSDDASGRRPAATLKTNARLSSPHSTVSSFSTPYPSTVKREDAEVDDDDEDGSARKKLRLTKEQSALLEDRFREHSTLNPKQKQALAKQLNLRPRQVEVWFQNRRARTKLKQTEVDCEFLKRCCEALTEENQRLQKEVNELRSLKFSPPPLYMQMPAATLTVCPSCERLAAAVRDGPKPTTGLPPSKPHFFNPLNHSAAC